MRVAVESLFDEIKISQDNKSFHPYWFKSEVSTISKKDWFSKLHELTTSDYVVIAETFLPILQHIPLFIPIIIFNQNGSYSFGLPNTQKLSPSRVLSTYHQSRIVQVWCVSEYDRQLLTQGFNIPVSKVHYIPNNIDFSTIHSDVPKQPSIAYFTRKNSSDQDIVVEMLKSRSWLGGWKLLPISSCSHHQVLDILARSSIYMSFGHPEGFGLPVAEAMASRCAVVGYTGLGGRELFNRANLYKCGIPVDFGDWLGFVNGLAFIHHRLITQAEEINHQLSLLSSDIMESYGFSACKKALLLALSDIIDK